MRVGQIIGMPKKNIEQYKKLHASVWPGVAKMIAECNIKNYSIYYKDEQLFAYFEYVGDDYAADMAKMAADETTQQWWDVCMPLQKPFDNRKQGEWWSDTEEVFHQD